MVTRLVHCACTVAYTAIIATSAAAHQSLSPSRMSRCDPIPSDRDPGRVMYGLIYRVTLDIFPPPGKVYASYRILHGVKAL